jgi:AcrR family transcriptional regulator
MPTKGRAPAQKTAALKESTRGLNDPAREYPGGHKQVSEIQRARIVAGMIAIVSEQGVEHASVARVVARSGVSRRTFYELFVDREECFIAAFDQCVQRIATVVLPAYRDPSKWRERVRAGLAALLGLLDREPAVARLVVVEVLGAGHGALERRRRGIAQVIALVDREGREAIAGEGPPPLTPEGLVGGVLSLIHARIVDGGDAPLLDLLGPLMAMIVLPYLGPAAARRELALAGTSPRLVPASRNGSAAAGTPAAGLDPLRDLRMRLTYRTIRVLLAIGELSGQGGSHPSNRQVGDAAGIRDQGQVSKLLARLRQLDLIENVSSPQVKGEPNAWTLTKHGEEVRAVLTV